ncbi:MAG: septal ring lytic transglycosylase RlpA family protein, partial [Alphaproteobacteria bacterium]
QIGAPYVVAGQTYVPQEEPNYSEVGYASWYGYNFHGRLTANGEIYDMNRLSAAHTTLPLPSYVRVTNLENGSSVVVRVNDRGPFHGDRIIDLSAAAAEMLGMTNAGIAQVQVDYIGRASLDGNDNRMLASTYQAPDARRAVSIAYDPATRTLSTRPGLGLFNRAADQTAAAVVYQPTALIGEQDPVGALLGRAQTYAALPALTPAQQAAELVAAGNLIDGDDPAVVQIGVFRIQDNANSVAVALTEFGIVTVTALDGLAETLWSVRVATDAARQQAVIDTAAVAGATGAYAITP